MLKPEKKHKSKKQVKPVAKRYNARPLRTVTLTANPNGRFNLRPLLVWELAALYGMDKKTLNKELQDMRNEVGYPSGYRYNLAQLKAIFRRLGAPVAFDMAEQ
jgi:hypothetical protein